MNQTRKPRFFYGYFVALAAFLIMGVAFGTLYTFGIFFEHVSEEFGWSRTLTSGAFSLYMVLHGLLYIIVGRLTDRLGPRLVITVCGLFLGLGYLLMSQISAVWQLYLFYGVMVAIGMSAFFVPLSSTVARWFVKRRGLMTGIVLAGIGVGTMLMPPLASWLISTYDWQTSYIIVGSIALVIIIAAAQLLRRDPGQMGQLPYGANEIDDQSINLGSGGFSLPEAIHTRQFWLLCAIFLLCLFSIQTIMVHVVIYATGLGISPTTAASILTIIGGLSIPGRIVMGSITDRVGDKLALITSLVLLSLSLFWFGVAREVWMLCLIAAIFGFAYGGSLAVMSPLVAHLFGLDSLGIILGIITFSGTIGGAIGPLVAGYIFDTTDSYQLAFSVCGAISIIAIILAILLNKHFF